LRTFPGKTSPSPQKFFFCSPFSPRASFFWLGKTFLSPCEEAPPPPNISNFLPRPFSLRATPEGLYPQGKWGPYRVSFSSLAFPTPPHLQSLGLPPFAVCGFSDVQLDPEGLPLSLTFGNRFDPASNFPLGLFQRRNHHVYIFSRGFFFLTPNILPFLCVHRFQCLVPDGKSPLPFTSLHKFAPLHPPVASFSPPRVSPR